MSAFCRSPGRFALRNVQFEVDLIRGAQSLLAVASIFEFGIRAAKEQTDTD